VKILNIGQVISDLVSGMGEIFNLKFQWIALILRMCVTGNDLRHVQVVWREYLEYYQSY
jgi:hypothetical protein